jgi:hypothetical protein
MSNGARSIRGGPGGGRVGGGENDPFFPNIICVLTLAPALRVADDDPDPHAAVDDGGIALTA